MPHPINAAVAALRTEKASDAELSSPARRGSASAFRAIVERNDRRLFRVARGVLKDGAEAEDAVQATCRRAFANLHAYAGSADLSAHRASSSPRASSTPSPWQARVARTGDAVLRRFGIEGLPPEPT